MFPSINYKFVSKPLPLYLKVKGCVIPVGVNQNTELNSSKVNGYSVSISIDSKYSKKVAELHTRKMPLLAQFVMGNENGQNKPPKLNSPHHPTLTPPPQGVEQWEVYFVRSRFP